MSAYRSKVQRVGRSTLIAGLVSCGVAFPAAQLTAQDPRSPITPPQGNPLPTFTPPAAATDGRPKAQLPAIKPLDEDASATFSLYGPQVLARFQGGQTPQRPGQLAPVAERTETPKAQATGPEPRGPTNGSPRTAQPPAEPGRDMGQPRVATAEPQRNEPARKGEPPPPPPPTTLAKPQASGDPLGGPVVEPRRPANGPLVPQPQGEPPREMGRRQAGAGEPTRNEPARKDEPPTPPPVTQPVEQPKAVAGANTSVTPGFTRQTDIESELLATRRMLIRFQAAWRLLVWPAGSTVTGCFVERNAEYRAALVTAANKWSAVANLKFDFGYAPGYRNCSLDNPSDIRVTFKPAYSSRSEIGVLALDVSPTMPTLYISTGDLGEQLSSSATDRADIMLHELGHAIGLPHEHQHPLSPCPADYRFETLCPRTETGQVVGANRYASVLSIFAGQRALIQDPEPQRLEPYDVKSVMHYRYPPSVLRGGRQSKCFVSGPYQISPGDTNKVGYLYPADPEAQRAMLKKELLVLARAISEAGVSEQAALSIKAMVEGRLQRRFPDLGVGLDLTPYVFKPRDAESARREADIAQPQRRFSPVCTETGLSNRNN